ncbi:MAG: hypothetical protein H7343_10460 [Undibacterium sp.]|nr:hypothetical protein [Opitutaceae bacterium]
MKVEERAQNLGGLVLNFHSLEFLLRAFMGGLPGAIPSGMPYGISVYTAKVGTVLPLDDFTNYATLGQLIIKPNKETSKLSLGPPIDESLVALRDAIAHGRVATANAGEPMRLIKSDRPTQKGTVVVVVNELMDELWFKTSRRRVIDAMNIVYSALNKLPEPKRPSV